MNESVIESPTVPSNEYERLVELAELDLDYTSLEDQLEDLTDLAARIVGTEVSLVNLIDSYTQWSVSNHGIDLQQMPREESVCQYTILDDEPLEIENLAEDERFDRKSYVTDGPRLRYYFGVPLTTSKGSNIGSLCVLDSEKQEISPEKKEMLQMVAREVVRRLEALRTIRDLHNKVEELNENTRKVSHDIRSPITGIIGIAQIMEEEIKNERVNELISLVKMIKKGGQSLLELANQIMDTEDSGRDKSGQEQLNCSDFCRKLEELYRPQATAKGVELNIQTLEGSEEVYFSKRRLLQLVGNLISNSIKFTDEGGTVGVELKTDRRNKGKADRLTVRVKDSGVGMSQEKMEQILKGEGQSEEGTGGEKGYGFGLQLVRHLVDKANGRMEISSEEGKGTTFFIRLPV